MINEILRSFGETIPLECWPWSSLQYDPASKSFCQKTWEWSVVKLQSQWSRPLWSWWRGMFRCVWFGGDIWYIYIHTINWSDFSTPLLLSSAFSWRRCRILFERTLSFLLERSWHCRLFTAVYEFSYLPLRSWMDSERYLHSFQAALFGGIYIPACIFR